MYMYIWFILFRNYYSRDLPHRASGVIPITQNNPGKEREEI